MTEPMLFDNIDEYEPFPDKGPVEGFGLSEEDLPQVKPADIVDMPIAIIGYIRAENKFKESEDDPDHVQAYEFLDSTNNKAIFWHTSPVLYRQVKERHDADQIPFKTKLILKPPRSAKGRPYYSFV
jgi:hypothetical protein